jgi:tetratricopeptide (TPR) repeat protein
VERTPAPSSRETKILLHLEGLRESAGKFVVPSAATQAGIAAGTGIAQPHVSACLGALERAGIAAARAAHIEGENRPKKAYFLTEQGLRLAAELRRAPAAFVSRPARLEPSPLFVGRDSELSQAVEWFDRGAAKVLMLRGMGGIGKSTLLAQFLNAVKGRAHVFLFRLHDWSSPGLLLRELAEFLLEAGRGSLADYLNSLPASAGPDPGLALFHCERALEGLRSVLAFDDLHEATPPVLSLLGGLAEAAGRTGVRLLVASREPAGAFGGRAAAEWRMIEIRLEGLDEGSVRAILERQGAALTLSPETIARIHRLTGGNPLFVRLLASSGGAASASSIHDFLSADLDRRLDEEDRRVLQSLSVFRGPVLASRFSHGSLGARARSLVERSLLVSDPAHGWVGQGSYSMHEVLRGFYYRSMDEQHRRAAHARAANYYRKVSGEHAVVERAMHLHLSGETAAAAGLLEESGPALLSRGMAPSLLPLLRSLPAASRSPRLLVLEAGCLRATGHVEEALPLCEAARGDCLSPAERLEIDAELVRCLHLLGRFREVERVSARALRDAARLPAGRARSLHQLRFRRTLALALRHALKYRESLRLFRHCLAEAERLRSPADAVSARNGIALCEIALGRPGEAASHFEEAHRAALRSGDLVTAAVVLNNLGTLKLASGDYDAAHDCYTRALRSSERIGDRENFAVACNNLGTAHSHRGEREAALHYLGKAAELSRRAGNRYLLAKVQASNGEEFARLGERERARACADEAARLAAELEDRELACAAALASASAAAREGDADATEKALAALRESARGLPTELQTARVHATLARLALETGRNADAAREAGEALREFASGRPREFEIAEALEVAGAAELKLGKGRAAKKHLQRASSIYAKVGARASARRCESLAEDA